MRPPAPAARPRSRSALAALATLLALAACAAPPPPAAPSPRGGAVGARQEGRQEGRQEAGRQEDAVESCRAEADRVVLFRDRGQLMREDDLDARVGLATNVVTARATSDRLGRQFERDRLAAECVRARTNAGPAAAGAALGAPSPPLR